MARATSTPTTRPTATSPQEYLPEVLEGARFYEPGPFGFEKRIAERLEWWARRKAGDATDSPIDSSDQGR